MTQEIATRDEQSGVADYSEGAMDRLGRWLQQADAVFAIAERICDTSFVPTAYRKKPAEAAAAMLAGAELGFDPMASLRAFDNINGLPAPKAITLRAVVLGAGHEIETVEQSATRAVVRGRRKGKTDWQVSTWDIERARKLPQFKSNPNYTSNPEAMLVARATAEACRWVAADAVMGMPYAAEEMSSEPSSYVNPRGVRLATRRLTVADLDAPAVEAEMIGNDQRKHMFALWRELGYDGDANRDARLAITAKILSLPDLESSSDLTRAEADQVIAALIERRDRTAKGGES